MVKRTQSILTEQKTAFVEALLDGAPAGVAAAKAGYSVNERGYGNAPRGADVRLAVAEARNELSTATQIKRADMIAVMMDAIDMARMMSDPTAMISGAREVGKMLGLYEPEKKQIDLTMNQSRVRNMFEAMSDQELLEVIEGEHVRLDS